MKKLIFTALAVVAFNGVSIANTIEKEEVLLTIEEVKQSNLIIEQNSDCYKDAMDTLDMIGTGDDVIDEQWWQILIADC